MVRTMKREEEGERDEEKQEELKNSKLKTLILEDSSVRSIWTI